MKTERTINYLKKRLEYLNQLVLESEEKRDILNIEKEQLFTQIEEYKDKIDEAYDVFSPKSTKNDFIKEQIRLFERKLNKINNNIENLQEQIELGKEEAEENYNNYEKYDTYEEYNPLVCKKIEVEKKKIRDIIYKCENCSTFMELDINRCKLELDNIIGLLENLLKYSNGKAEENEEI